MQKTVFVLALFALVAVSLADHGKKPEHAKTPGKGIEDHDRSGGKLNHRVARGLPPLDQIRSMAEEHIKKLPEPVQEAIRKAKSAIEKFVPSSG